MQLLPIKLVEHLLIRLSIDSSHPVEPGSMQLAIVRESAESQSTRHYLVLMQRMDRTGVLRS